MNLRFQKFTRDDFLEYLSWFDDPALNSALGPMVQDDEWLDAVLAEDEAEGMTYAVFRGAELVGVAEVATDPHRVRPVVIRAVAVKPALRRQGIATQIVRRLLDLHAQRGGAPGIAYLSVQNSAARSLFAQLGFRQISREPDQHGMLEYRHQADLYRPE